MAIIGIVINPKSKFFRENPGELEGIKQIIKSGKSDRVLLRITESPGELQKIALEFKRQNVDILAISGGDGTFQVVLTDFIKVYDPDPLPKIVFLRAGTMNTIATSLKIYGSPKSILAKLLKKQNDDNNFIIVERYILKVNDRYGFIFGNGFFYNFLKIYYERAYPSIFKGFLLLLNTFFACIFGTSLKKEIFNSFDVKILLDGKEFDQKNVGAISCSTIPFLGYGFNTYYRALERENHYHVIGFYNKPFYIAANIMNFFIGRTSSQNATFDQITKKMVFETENPLGYQLDGDMIVEGNKIIIETGPLLQLATGDNF